MVDEPVVIPFFEILGWVLPFVFIAVVLLAAFHVGRRMGEHNKVTAEYRRWEKPGIGDTLELEAVKLMQVAKICPFCLTDLLQGPGGQMSRNFYCKDPACNSRFNIVDLPPEHPQWRPWGQYLGPLPDDVLIDLRLRQAHKIVTEGINDAPQSPHQ